MNESINKRAASIADNGVVKIIERIAVTLLVAGVGWLISTTSQTKTQLAVLSEKVAIMGEDRYTGATAARDLQTLRQSDDNSARRIGRLEGRLDQLQRDLNELTRRTSQ